jgi:hypothetical protein
LPTPAEPALKKCLHRLADLCYFDIIDVSTLQRPVLLLGLSTLQRRVLHLDVSTLQRHVLHIDVSTLQKPVLNLDVSPLQRSLLHLDVSTSFMVSCAVPEGVYTQRPVFFSLEMSTLQGPELHLNVSTLCPISGHAYTTKGCAAPGRVNTTEAGAAP